MRFFARRRQGQQQQPATNPSPTRCHYDVLGIPKNATAREISQAYRSLARSFHPDSRQNLDPNQDTKHQQDEQNRIFSEINGAYTALSDPDARAQYDLYGHQPRRRTTTTRTPPTTNNFPNQHRVGISRFTRFNVHIVSLVAFNILVIRLIALLVRLPPGPTIHKFPQPQMIGQSAIRSAREDLIRKGINPVMTPLATPQEIMAFGAKLAQRKAPTHYNFPVYQMTKDGNLTLIHKVGDPIRRRRKQFSAATNQTVSTRGTQKLNVKEYSDSLFVSSTTFQSELKYSSMFPPLSSPLARLKRNQPVTNGTHFNVTVYISRYAHEERKFVFTATYRMGDRVSPRPLRTTRANDLGAKYWLMLEPSPSSSSSSYGSMVEWNPNSTNVIPITNGTHFVYDIYRTHGRARRFFNVRQNGEPIFHRIMFGDFSSAKDHQTKRRAKWSNGNNYWIYNGTYEKEVGATAPLVELAENQSHLIDNGTHYLYDVYHPPYSNWGRPEFKLVHQKGELVAQKRRPFRASGRGRAVVNQRHHLSGRRNRANALKRHIWDKNNAENGSTRGHSTNGNSDRFFQIKISRGNTTTSSLRTSTEQAPGGTPTKFSSMPHLRGHKTMPPAVELPRGTSTPSPNPHNHLRGRASAPAIHTASSLAQTPVPARNSITTSDHTSLRGSRSPPGLNEQNKDIALA